MVYCSFHLHITDCCCHQPGVINIFSHSLSHTVGTQWDHLLPSVSKYKDLLESDSPKNSKWNQIKVKEDKKPLDV